MNIKQFIQLQGKVPKSIFKRIRNNNLFLNEYFYYNLETLVPISCLSITDRMIVERFGIDRCKMLDMELIRYSEYIYEVNLKEMLLRVNPNTKDLNHDLYEMLSGKIKPSDYSALMKEYFSSVLFNEESSEDERFNLIRSKFNTGILTIDEIINNWDLLKDKDFSYALEHDYNNRSINITVNDIRLFMSKYESLAPFIVNKTSKNIYDFIYNYNQLITDEERSEYIKSFTDELLENNKKSYFGIELENSEYEELFKYSSIRDFLINSNSYSSTSRVEKFLSNLEKYPKGYLYTIPFPIKVLLNNDALQFINEFGLDNIVEFDRENDGFFSRNNCETLKKVYEMFLHYGHNESDENKSVYYDKDGNYLYGNCNKEQFYQVIRKMILYGPNNYDYKNDFLNYSMISGVFKDMNPDLFLSSDTPEELQRLFYSKALTPGFLKEHSDCIKYLRGKNVVCCFKNKEIEVINSENEKEYKNLYEYLIEIAGFDDAFAFICEYGDILDKIFKERLSSSSYEIVSKSNDFNEFKNIIMELYSRVIIDARRAYSSDVPDSFKEKYPYLFLDENVPNDIKEKFYNRKFTIEDFKSNPGLLDYFKNTNVACAINEDVSWVTRLLIDEEDKLNANKKRLKIIDSYLKIKDPSSALAFKTVMMDNASLIDVDKIDYVYELLVRMIYSNSLEVQLFKNQLFVQLSKTDNPIESLEKIEEIFLRNNLPLCGKMFLCFKILYPDLDHVVSFNFQSGSRVSPQLKDESLPQRVGFHETNNEKRLNILFNDLLRISYRSNERSLVEYLDNIEKGNELFLLISQNEIDINSLSEADKAILDIFTTHLDILYRNIKPKSLNIGNLSLEEKLKLYVELFKPNDKYDLKDRIVRSFCYFAGIKSYDELIDLMNNAKSYQAKRREQFIEELEDSGGVFSFEEGDFVRGIGTIESFGSTLASGNYCKEHLGSFIGTSTSDTTPLDVDLTLITRTESIYKAIEGTPTGFGFGNIYVIFKKDNPCFNITRDKHGDLLGREYNPRQIEVFGTSIKGSGGYETHWGARTGFAFTDVDAILYKENRKINAERPYRDDGRVNYEDAPEGFFYDLPALKFEIAKNGYYIPVIDFSGKLIFTIDEYNAIRKRMDGLSYFENNNYILSNNLMAPGIEQLASELTEEATLETTTKRMKIVNIIKQVLDEFNLGIKLESDGDLTPGSVEFIDTGSTGRNSNVPHDGDFDFFMRIDNNIMLNEELLSQFKNKLFKTISSYETEETIITDMGDFRFKGVKVDSETTLDIDISFGVKTNKVTYSSDRCLKDRLDTIKKLYPDQYKYVIANIILAKKILKSCGAYKPRKSDKTQGGMGGVGVENWILQNGGSLIDAVEDFLSVALDKNGRMISFEEFRSKYEVWDFGENFFSARKGHYTHDNFVSCNMTKEGYEKMVSTLKEIRSRGFVVDQKNIKSFFKSKIEIIEKGMKI